MVLPSTNDRMIPVRIEENAFRRVRPLDHDKATGDMAVVSQINVGTETLSKIPRDQVGKCDNLIASFWG